MTISTWGRSCEPWNHQILKLTFHYTYLSGNYTGIHSDIHENAYACTSQTYAHMCTHTYVHILHAHTHTHTLLACKCYAQNPCDNLDRNYTDIHKIAHNCRCFKGMSILKNLQEEQTDISYNVPWDCIILNNGQIRGTHSGFWNERFEMYHSLALVTFKHKT